MRDNRRPGDTGGQVVFSTGLRPPGKDSNGGPETAHNAGRWGRLSRSTRVLISVLVAAGLIGTSVVLIVAVVDDSPGNDDKADEHRPNASAFPGSATSSMRAPAPRHPGPSSGGSAVPHPINGSSSPAARPPSEPLTPSVGPGDAAAHVVSPTEADAMADPAKAGDLAGTMGHRYGGATAERRTALTPPESRSQEPTRAPGDLPAVANPSGPGGAGVLRRVDVDVASQGDSFWREVPQEDGVSRRVARFVSGGGAGLRGRVVDTETRKPLASVVVEAHLAGSFMETVTDSAGTFKMSGLLPEKRVKVWIVGNQETFVAEYIDVSIPGEGETADTGLIGLLRGGELADHLGGWVGLFVGRRGRRNVVTAVSPWLPADRADVEVGEAILSIDGRNLDGFGPRATSFLLRGPVGSKTNVTLQDRLGIVRRVQLDRVLR